DFDLDLNYLALLLLIFGFGLIGFADDFLKIRRKQNLGLTFWQKIIIQFILAGLFSCFLIRLGYYQNVSSVLQSFGFSNPMLYFLLSTFIILGGANAANLTDGLNGLLAGCASIAFLFFAILALNCGLPEAATFCVLSSGAIAAFLLFNFPRAHVFMGDAGSLSIGAALGGIALVIHQELALAVIGGIFVIEALSVIIQVSCYKLFKRRVFKMTPLHHHFELLGYKETVIVVGFWVVAVVLGIAGILVKLG
ncbi:MAG: phospho-N-acetylmuramoyl-pentapeptide-transferase, partial [Candidatus Margulisbacteria bacterium]|nr:phospho-N-acetylmuramoyl-pentapeptide-transferase [Candidatus Margulisiibacteriota bacterium]